MPVQEEISQTLEADIIETARLLFQSKGFDHTSLMDITMQLNISDQMIFQHFTSLDEILEVVWAGSY